MKYVALSDEGAIELSAEAAFPVSRRDGYFMVSLPASPSNVRAVNTSRTVRLEWGRKAAEARVEMRLTVGSSEVLFLKVDGSVLDQIFPVRRSRSGTG